MFIPWSKPDFGNLEKRAAIRVIKSGWLTQGKETEAFEYELSRYLGVKHVVAVNSGTSALIAALLAHDIGPGDEVIAPSFTFIATVNSIIAVGAKPVLVDCNQNTWDISCDVVERHITKKTRAIMPVDVAGMPIDVDGFRKLSRKYKIPLIEDAAQAIGAVYIGKKIGSFGHATIFSFHMAKLLTTVEGGCVAVNDQQIADRIRMIRSHGRKELYVFKKHGTEYNFDGFGLNLRFNDVQASIGRVQLKKINKAILHRSELVNLYKKELEGLFEFQQIPSYVTTHANFIFGILCQKNKRDFINKKLYEKEISTRITWLPAHLQKWHKDYFGSLKLKNSENLSSRIISIPLGNGLSFKEAEKVIGVLKKVA